MKRDDPAVTAMREHMLAHLDSVSDCDERRALTQELQAYFWRYPFSVEDIPGGFAGFAVFETGEITIAPGQLQVGSAEALNTYLHEIAHVICFMYPHLGVGHDEGWQEVSKRLGGTGRSTFENECDLRITKPPRYIYVVPGVKDNIYLSPQRHNYLQSGEGIYRFKESGIEIRKEHYTGRWL